MAAADDRGYFLPANPANAFFYLITGVHGLHVLGGLVAWAGPLSRRGAAFELEAGCASSVELVPRYWHFLLLVWLVLFALLTGWAGDFVAICRAVADLGEDREQMAETALTNTGAA